MSLYGRFYSGGTRKTDDIPKAPLLYVPSHPSREMDRDLERAGIRKWDPRGKIDFHACRVVYVTLVLESGASLKEAQALARHGTADLTLNVYGRAREARLAAVAQTVGEKVLVVRPNSHQHACQAVPS